MDHAEVREALELAAAEPRGFERLEAGDTPEAAAVASHLVDCPACRAEWQRLAALSRQLRSVFAPASASPAAPAAVKAPAELKARTLRYVRELGKPVSPEFGILTSSELSGNVADEQSEAGSPSSAAMAEREPAAVVSIDRERSRMALFRRRSVLLRIAAIAAVIVVVASIGGFAYLQQQQLTEERETNAVLADLSQAQAALAVEPDVKSVTLTSSDGAMQGWVVFSAGKDEMVMLARGVAQPSAGYIYRCWVETPSGRRVLGDALVTGNMAYWKGWPESGLADVKPGDRFGVSLVETAGGAATVQLTGTVR